MQTPFTYHIGQTLRILEGIYQGHTFTLMEEDDFRMSSGIISIPEYYYRGRWYTENEVELVEGDTK